MRETLTVAAVAAGSDAFALGGLAQAAGTGDFGTASSPIDPTGADVSSALRRRVRGHDVANRSGHQQCDNKDHAGRCPRSAGRAGGNDAAGFDASSAAHWRVLGHELGAPSPNQDYDNGDRVGSRPRSAGNRTTTREKVHA